MALANLNVLTSLSLVSSTPLSRDRHSLRELNELSFDPDSQLKSSDVSYGSQSAREVS